MFSVIALVVLPSIQLYREPHRWTIKVQNIWAYAVLAEEFHPEKLFIADLRPQSPFRIALITSQLPSPLF
jgi:hypothetical protein